LTWLIVINNCYSGSGILSLQFSHGVRVIELNEEILIWLPVVVIIDGNLNEGSSLSLFENNRFINFFIIVTGFGFGVDGGHVNSTCCSFLVQNVNSD